MMPSAAERSVGAARTDHHAIGLLDVEPDLGAGLSDRDRREAREQVVLPAYDVPAGDWDLAKLGELDRVSGEVLGFLVCSGVLTIDVRLAHRTCVRALTCGDIVFFDGIEADSISSTWGWSALEPSLLAILDRRLLVIGHRWPKLLQAIIMRAAEQTREAHLQQAISQLPRVEDRVIALLWNLADRVGRTERDGVTVPIALKHETIARMVGARRPTVTLALTSLTDQGLLKRTPAGWQLSRRSLAAFNATSVAQPSATRARGPRPPALDANGPE